MKSFIEAITSKKAIIRGIIISAAIVGAVALGKVFTNNEDTDDCDGYDDAEINGNGDSQEG